MDVLHPRCCGLDVHKSSISACILVREAGRVQKHQRRFAAMTQDLQELAEWLRQFGVTQVESLTESPDPRFHRFRRMFHLSAFPLCRARGLHAPCMFLICPIDPHPRRELGFLPQDFAF
jgi:hypothetical protein